MNASDFSDLILKLGASAVDSPPAEHQARMITLLGDVIGFDAAWYGWSSFTGGRISLLNCVLHGLPAGFDPAARAMLDVDPFVRHGRKLPVFAIAVQPASDRISPKYSDFAAGFGITAMMNGHCRMGGNSPYNFFMSFYRMTGRAPFNHEETQDFRLILRHLEQSLSQTLRSELQARAGLGGEAALLDTAGQIIRTTRGFNAFLATEALSLRQGGALLRKLSSAPGQWRGKGISARSETYAPGLSIICLARLQPRDQLSPRERQVVTGLLRGESSRQIAEQLGVSVNTVRNQVAAIYQKLGISRRVQLLGRWPTDD